MSYRVSPSSVCLIIRETLAAIIKILQRRYLPNPSQETWTASEARYRLLWNFPHAVGAIDGKHVRVKLPPASGSLYYNYKGFYSIVLLAISNADFQFQAVDIGAFGSESDAGILGKSTMGQLLETGQFGIPRPKPVSAMGPTLPHVILGDDAFPLRNHLMKPFKGNFLSRENSIFNYRLSRARMTVENSFGILAARWRIFHSVIEADVDLAKSIIMASILLHNFLTSKSDFNNISPDRVENGAIIEGSWRQMVQGDRGMVNIPQQGSNNYSRNSSQVRDAFVNYFMTDEGKVRWQDVHVSAGR